MNDFLKKDQSSDYTNI